MALAMELVWRLLGGSPHPVQHFTEPRDDVRMLLGKVVVLTRIIDDIEKQEAIFGKWR